MVAMVETAVELGIGVVLFLLVYRAISGKWPWQARGWK
jgi:hypothetical protein